MRTWLRKYATEWAHLCVGTVDKGADQVHDVREDGAKRVGAVHAVQVCGGRTRVGAPAQEARAVGVDADSRAVQQATDPPRQLPHRRRQVLLIWGASGQLVHFCQDVNSVAYGAQHD